MGVTRWLDRIDPDVWQEAVRRVQPLPSTPGEVIAFLAIFDKKPYDSMLDALTTSPGTGRPWLRRSEKPKDVAIFSALE
jgi:hypothetical protein